MLAKTYPVPKKYEDLRPQDIRPITVLAQTFRLWSKVLTQHLLRTYAPSLPTQVRGFVPGQSATDASYVQQVIQEEAMRTGQGVSGFTLDLVKCYNTVNRQAVAYAVQHLQLPPQVTQQWIQSQDQITRIWAKGPVTSQPQTTHNGLTEGDPLAVLIMILIGTMWVQYSKAQVADIGLNIYADNWTWYAQDPSSHADMAQATHTMVQAFGMHIDWGKSWMWSSDPDHVQPFTEAVRPFSTSTELQEFTSSMDLGAQLTYRGPCKLGRYRDRLQEAERRLKIIQYLPYDLATKTHLVMTSVFPQVFYYAELIPLGKRHLI